VNIAAPPTPAEAVAGTAAKIPAATAMSPATLDKNATPRRPTYQ
jgi:hypothetical protein